MPTHELLSGAQRAGLLRIPDRQNEADEVARHYQLSAEDLEIIRVHRKPSNRLGYAVQLCVLRFPGQALRPGDSLPWATLAYIAEQVGVTPSRFQHYSHSRTRWEHLNEIQKTFHFENFISERAKELRRFLMPLALSTHHGMVLISALVEEMRSRKIIIPSLSAVEDFAWKVRRSAERKVFRRLVHGLTLKQKQSLDALSSSFENSHQTKLSWLKNFPQTASAESFLKVVERIDFIRSLKLDPESKKRIHHNRLVQLAREGGRYTPQSLSKFHPDRRHATLVAFLFETSEELTDQALNIHDRLTGRLFNRGERKQLEGFQKSSKAINEKVRLLADVGNAMIEARQAEKDPFGAIESILPWERFILQVKEAEALSRPENFDFLDLLEDFYPQVRKYTPRLLESFEFKATSSRQGLIDALALLRNLNTEGTRKLPEAVPRSFVPPRWKGHVFTSKTETDRRFYELCALSELRSALRAGDVWVEGSKQFKNLEEYLLTPTQWRKLKKRNQVPLSIEQDFPKYLAQKKEALDFQLKAVEALLTGKNSLPDPDVRFENDRLKIRPLRKAVPEEAEETKRRIYALIPRIKLTELLVEVDGWTGFTRYFTHLYSGEPVKDKAVLMTAALGEATNLGLSKIADACPEVTFDKLAWVSKWYLREENITKALSEIINFHHGLSFPRHWGDGTTSSSDGQNFKLGSRRDSVAQVNARYGNGASVNFYTHISDQYSPFYAQAISSTIRDATHVLDGLLYHETDLEIREHYTDTAGYTDQVFALCHLLGFRFAPRIASLADRRLYSLEKTSCYSGIAPILSGTIQVNRIETHWDEILRLASSLRKGTVTASLIVRKLASYPKQNGLALALRELGRIERSLFALDWLQSPELRRRVQIGLNKGEAKNDLARAVFFHRRGEIYDRSFEDQRHRASSLNLVLAAIILWNTVYLERAVKALNARGVEIDISHLKHLSPLGWEHITLTGEYFWNLDEQTTLEKLRPLRIRKKLAEQTTVTH